MKKRVQAMLDCDTVKELEKIAASKHITVSAVVRQMVEEGIKSKTETVQGNKGPFTNKMDAYMDKFKTKG